MKFTGYVKIISDKSGKSAKGKAWTSYSGIILQENGAETGWLSFGFDKPPFKQGDYAEVEASEGKYGLEVTAAKKLDAPAKPAAQPVSSGATAYAPKGNYVDRNDSIVYQSSRKDALQLVGLLLEHDGLPMTGAATKAAVAKRFDEITAFVDKITVEFYHDVQSLRLLSSVVDAGSTETPGGTEGSGATVSQAEDDA